MISVALNKYITTIYVLLGLSLIIMSFYIYIGQQSIVQSDVIEPVKKIQEDTLIQVKKSDVTESVEMRQGGTLIRIKERGKLICGVGGDIKGFSYPSDNNNYLEYEGLEADLCRVIAVAIFGTDREKISFRKVGLDERFDVITNGEIDVLLRNTTWTSERDTALDIDFGPVYFHDGQKVLIKKKNGDAKYLEYLRDMRICVKSGTTSLINIRSAMSQRDIEYVEITGDNKGEFPDNAASKAAFDRGYCDALTSDESTLVGLVDGDMSGYEIIPNQAISYEPLAVVVGNKDPIWKEIVTYAIWATMWAEQEEITSSNIRAPFAVKTFEALELSGTTEDIIKKIGNYGEIYKDNLESLIPREKGENRTVAMAESGWNAVPPLDTSLRSISKNYTINFEFDEAILTRSGKEDVVGLIRDLKEFGNNLNSIEIIGHTDSRGGETHNEDLSKRRAKVIADILTLEFENAFITSDGKGATDPIADNDNEAGRARNRRVEVVAKVRTQERAVEIE